MEDSNREKIEDKIFNENLENIDFHNRLFIRIGAKDKHFRNVDFSHTYFEYCYFRNCIFDKCKFNGCKFINSNLVGSSFPDSEFEYTSFDKTLIDSDILLKNNSKYNNLQLKFARALRINYQSLGDSESVNKAIEIELNATRKHLYNSWHSSEPYYRKKYLGWNKRTKMFFSWLRFKFEEFIWGNGEILWYLFRAFILTLLLLIIVDLVFFKRIFDLIEFWNSLSIMPSVFLGIEKPSHYPSVYLSAIALWRLILIAFFISIITKRLNRR